MDKGEAKDMQPPQPDLVSSFEYAGEIIGVEWYELDKDVPDLPWQQVYVIGDLDGQVPIVHYEDGHNNLPGGKTEPGETVDETIRREIDEEINCEVLDWQPIGYQKLTEPNGRIKYQLRVVAHLKKVGDFRPDIGGKVIGFTTVPLEQLNSRINYGDVGELIVDRARNMLEK